MVGYSYTKLYVYLEHAKQVECLYMSVAERLISIDEKVKTISKLT